jgi:hypothetical protein
VTVASALSAGLPVFAFAVSQPAWGSFPATDRYDPTRLWLTCVSLALRFGLVAEDPGLRRETASSSAAMATAPTAAATMPTGVVA